MNREFLVRISYMEIYNEDINDLLVPDHRKLQIKESIEVFWLIHVFAKCIFIFFLLLLKTTNSTLHSMTC